MVDDYVALSRFPLLYKEDFTKTTIVSEMDKEGYFTATMKGLLEIKPANMYEAITLDIKAGEPIAVFRNTGYDAGGRSLSYSIVQSLAYETSYEIYTEHLRSNSSTR